MNCSSVGLFHGVQSRKRLRQHRGSQVPPANLLQVGSSLHGSSGPARSLLQHGLPTGSQRPLGTSTCSSVWSSMACRWTSAPLWTSMGCGGTACLTMVFSTGSRGISAPAPGAPRPPPSSLTLVSAELFLSDVLTPLSLMLLPSSIFPFLKYIIRGATTVSDGLSHGQQWLHLGDGWHWLC